MVKTNRSVSPAKKRQVAAIYRQRCAESVYGYLCPFKGRELQQEERETDHIIPLKNGGSNRLYNLQLLCRACHGVKSDRERKGIYHIRVKRKRLRKHSELEEINIDEEIEKFKKIQNEVIELIDLT